MINENYICILFVYMNFRYIIESRASNSKLFVFLFFIPTQEMDTCCQSHLNAWEWLRVEQCCLAIPPFSMLKHRIHKKQLSTVHTAYMIEYINIMLFGPLPVCLSHFDCPMHTLHNSRHLAYGFSNCSWSAPKLLKGTYVSYNTITYFTINRCLSTTIKDLTKLVRHL